MLKIIDLKILLCAIALLLFSSPLLAQVGLAEIPQQYKQFVGENDSIVNVTQLHKFFDKLKALQQGDSGIVRIVHIGDSHIQADILTGMMRQLFQQNFGNAGRGLIAPLRIAKTNEPADYRLSSDNKWEIASIRKTQNLFLPGVAGVSVQSKDTIIGFRLKTNFRNDTVNAFNKIDFVANNTSKYPLIFIKDSLSEVRALGVIENDTLSTVHLPKLVNDIEIYTSNDLRLDAMLLYNGKSGVLYHNIGINGGHISDYNRSKKMFEQMKLLQPDLVIVSLGTNEGVVRSISSDRIISDLKMLQSNFTTAHIDAPLLIVAPFDNYYRRKNFNPYLATVKRAMELFSKQNNIAFADMYNITGGYKSAAKWKRAGLLRADGVHYAREGYELQGMLLFNVLMNNYFIYAD